MKAQDIQVDDRMQIGGTWWRITKTAAPFGSRIILIFEGDGCDGTLRVPPDFDMQVHRPGTERAAGTGHGDHTPTTDGVDPRAPEVTT